MKVKNYTFEFYNPNSPEATASFFLTLAVAANAKSIEEQILHTVANQPKAKSPKKTAFLSASV